MPLLESNLRQILGKRSMGCFLISFACVYVALLFQFGLHDVNHIYLIVFSTLIGVVSAGYSAKISTTKKTILSMAPSHLFLRLVFSTLFIGPLVVLSFNAALSQRIAWAALLSIIINLLNSLRIYRGSILIAVTIKTTLTFVIVFFLIMLISIVTALDLSAAGEEFHKGLVALTYKLPFLCGTWVAVTSISDLKNLTAFQEILVLLVTMMLASAIIGLNL